MPTVSPNSTRKSPLRVNPPKRLVAEEIPDPIPPPIVVKVSTAPPSHSLIKEIEGAVQTTSINHLPGSESESETESEGSDPNPAPWKRYTKENLYERWLRAEDRAVDLKNDVKGLTTSIASHNSIVRSYEQKLSDNENLK